MTENAPPSRPSSRVVELRRKLMQWIPPRARLAVCIAFIVPVVALFMYLSSSSSVLNLVCQHSLTSADLSVIVDGQTKYSDHISGTVKRRFGFLDKRVKG